MNIAASAVAAVPELLEKIIMSLPLDDPRRMMDVFAWRRTSSYFQQLIRKSFHLQHLLYLLDEIQVVYSTTGKPCCPASRGVCDHDVGLRANPLIPIAFPGFKDCSVDYDDSKDPDTNEPCRRWHFAMELDPGAAAQWRQSAATAQSWRGLLITQPACRGVAISWLERDGDGNNVKDETYDETCEHLYFAHGVTLGKICDKCSSIVERVGHSDFRLYVDRSELE